MIARPKQIVLLAICLLASLAMVAGLARANESAMRLKASTLVEAARAIVVDAAQKSSISIDNLLPLFDRVKQDFVDVKPLADIRSDIDSIVSALKSTKLEPAAVSKATEDLDHAKWSLEPAGSLGDGGGPTPTAPPHGVIDSVNGYFDDGHPAPQRYGRYTYVLISHNSDRNAAFLDTLVKTTPPIGGIPVSARLLNAFLSPIEKSSWKKLVAAEQKSHLTGKLVASYYDYGRAHAIIVNTCETATRKPKLCGTAFTGGPYLLTSAAPVGSSNTPKQPCLLIDLTTVNSGAFGFFVDRMKEQVKISDISDTSRIKSTRGNVLSLVLNASNFVDGVVRSMSTLMAFIK